MKILCCLRRLLSRRDRRQRGSQRCVEPCESGWVSALAPSLIRRRQPRETHPRRQPQSRLEELEVRCLLATFTVTTTAADGADSLREAIKLGVAKVNYGTYLKLRYLRAVRGALQDPTANPHELLGLGGAHDVMVTGRLAVRDAVLERIETLGCSGRT